ncbi:hypothetical protein H9Q09_00670 [Aurantimonas sp. DM33-3]|uniref:hypothetical protein n=1 Tax=Aurantimonas sp. DM33-3 TaxID=2766955 RepID=UPI0016521071|nr:hypothetical protein [Aurantimonas sp. DM33-3]MBC6714698.1 hypothetical protein [Aurantimonas sp. DM33-3]
MDTIAPSFAGRSSAARAAVSNGTRLLSGVDGRSASARRFRDLVRSLSDELGGEASLTEPQRAMVRHAAGVMIQAERMQSAIVRGETIDAEQLVRLSNTLARMMKDIGVKAQAAKPKAPDLASYLGGRVAV